MSTPSSLEDIIKDLGEISQEASIEAYMVGGFVRDRVLGRSSKDIDCVVVGKSIQDGPEKLIRALSQKYGWGEPTIFARFGTVHIRQGELIVEAVMARNEQYNPESRKPNVNPGTLEEDLWRRDFTINALAQKFDGTIVDITGKGLQDLKDGVLRTPLNPKVTFEEDPLRMFRAARFVAKLGFVPTEELVEAMQEMAPRTRILSVERISEELKQILVAPYAAAGLELLHQGGLLDEVFPELQAMVGCEQDDTHHLYDVWGHSITAVSLAVPEPLVRLAALLHDVGKPATLAITEDGRRTFYGHDSVGAPIAGNLLRRMRFPEADVLAIEKLVQLHLRPILYNPQKQGDSSLRRLVKAAGPLRQELLNLARADAGASRNTEVRFLDELEERLDGLDVGGAVSEGITTISGDELMQMTGWGPGRWIKEVKGALEEAVIEGEFSSGDVEAARLWLVRHPEVLSGETLASPSL